MARESVKILQGKLDVESLISQLNAALAEEWLAYYQYWVGALVVEGAMRADVQGEFEEHAEEERRHAQLLADRIIELEGVPVLDPKQWFELARCKYDAPQGFDSVSLLKDNVASERCAILRYQEIADFTNGKAEKAKQVISLGTQFGEGWLISGEILSFASQGVNHVISLQPFGCIANHIVEKGIEKRIKSLCPQMNILSLDFDSSVSDVNITNRLLLFIDNINN